MEQEVYGYSSGSEGLTCLRSCPGPSLSLHATTDNLKLSPMIKVTTRVCYSRCWSRRTRRVAHLDPLVAWVTKSHTATKVGLGSCGIIGRFGTGDDSGTDSGAGSGAGDGTATVMAPSIVGWDGTQASGCAPLAFATRHRNLPWFTSCTNLCMASTYAGWGRLECDREQRLRAGALDGSAAGG